jgi:3-dehydroquinate synthase
VGLSSWLSDEIEKMQSVEVSISGYEYKVVIGPGVVKQLLDQDLPVCNAHRLAVIADATVARLHQDSLSAVLPDCPHWITFEPGEANKSLDTLRTLLDGLAEAQLDRHDLVLTFGGGLAGDMGGFAAAIWMRGVRFIQVPTTIEAAVDAAVGGKTAVNHPVGKNMIGAFHQPSAVVIDTDFLETLPQRDFLAGWAESVKHAVIRDPEFFGWHEQHAEQLVARDPVITSEAIGRNVAIKAEVVAQDEREHGLRAILNHGHTVGHALELRAEYDLRHGECVALGMLVENAIAVGRGLLDSELAKRIHVVIARLGLPTQLPRAIPIEQIISAAARDKKNRGGRTVYLIITALGQTLRIDDVREAELAAGLETIQPA